MPQGQAFTEKAAWVFLPQPLYATGDIREAWDLLHLARSPGCGWNANFEVVDVHNRRLDPSGANLGDDVGQIGISLSALCPRRAGRTWMKMLQDLTASGLRRTSRSEGQGKERRARIASDDGRRTEMDTSPAPGGR